VNEAEAEGPKVEGCAVEGAEVERRTHRSLRGSPGQRPALVWVAGERVVGMRSSGLPSGSFYVESTGVEQREQRLQKS
jgi:hypothetical protein